MPQQTAAGLAGLLRQLRTDAGMTQDELAEAAGLSTRTVSDLERGVNVTARRDTAALLADALSLTGNDREHFMAVARGKPSAGLLMPAGGASASNTVWIESAASETFVGRQAELAALASAWTHAAGGHRVLALVGGEPGIGKTALVAELARQVHAGGGLVLYGRWDEYVPAPYGAFREALTDYARACPEPVLRRDLAGLAGEVTRLYPVPAQRAGIESPPAPPAAPEAERFRLFESFEEWTERMAGRQPVLLVLDDLQWADQSSLLLLGHLMRARRSTPLLAVAMYRDTGPEPDDLAASWAALTRDVDCRRVTLRGLGHDAVTALLETVLPGGGKRAAGLERETAGNPFFLLEMARRLPESTPGGETPPALPPSVRDMIGARLRRLTDDCAAVLMMASLIGERFDTALLASVAGLEETRAIVLLEEAVQAGLVAEAEGDPDWWRFSHSLTRRVAADGLSRSRRARLQLKVAETLEARPGVPPAELAHHFGTAARGSGDPGAAGKAIGYERLAGEHALREVAAEVAVRHFRQAIGLLDRFRAGQDALRCELLLRLADAHDRAGQYAPRDERYAEAAETATRLEDGTLLCRAALGYGGILPATVDPDPLAQALLEEALAQDGISDSSRARVLARLAHWLHTARPYAERRELADRAVSMARGTPDRLTLAAVLLHRCWALDGPDDVADALETAREIEGIGEELRNPELTLQALRIRLHAEFELGGHDAAAATAGDLKRLAEEVRHPEFIRLAAMWDVTAASFEGRFGDAGKLADELDQRLSRLGHPQAQVIPVAQTFARRWLQGRAGEYIPVFEALSASDPGNPVWTAVTAWSLAEAGETGRASALLGSVGPGPAAAADKNYLWWALVVGLSDAAVLTGDAGWARALYDLAAPYAGHNATLGVATFLGACDHWLGVLAGTAGRTADAVAHLEAALARHEQMGARPWTELTREALGRVRSGAGLTARPGTS
ncbi:MAG: AAA family ATPase [Streptosporangiales bacterium]|nr:AAA family ATPase [Streptosporangiales bacterium]